MRTVIVLMVITARAAYFLLEQPGSSKVTFFPELIYALRVFEGSGVPTFFQRLLGAWWK